MELIAVTAAAHPGEGERYNTRQDASVIRRYLRAARRAKALLVLDVQPGRSDFFTEVTRLRRWLKEPDVGLALDPEWRMGPGEVPGQVIGSVEAREVNAVTAWLSQLVVRDKLPQKLLLIHQFTDDMVDDTQLQERDGLAMVLNADGFGTRQLKRIKYRAFTSSPRRFFHTGFKLFYREDMRLMKPRAGAAAAAAARRRDLRVTLRLPDPCLVVLVGATGAGKSAWAARVVRRRRGGVLGPAAGGRRGGRARSAREPRRVRAARPDRGQAAARAGSRPWWTPRGWSRSGGRRGGRSPRTRACRPTRSTFDVPEKVVRERNRARGAPVPAKVVAAQLREAAAASRVAAGEGFAGVAAAAPVELVPPAFLGAPGRRRARRSAPLPLEFGLQVSRFEWRDGPTAAALADVARAAEEAGFTSLWLMDHFLQIPQVGREWEDMLESHTTLGYLAGVT